MTAITRNLPGFIRDPAVKLIGQECYESLVTNLHLGDTPCLKLALSKGLGVGIVVGGSIMKVPQMMLIWSAKSARGLSLPAYILETMSYAITTVYSSRNHYPFSTYGENLFLTAQNVVITFAILHYSRGRQQLAKGQSSSLNLTVACGATILAAYALYIVPLGTLQWLQMLTVPLSVLSKLPQISSNYNAKSTGQLSAFAVLAQIAGCLARVFTTSTEVGDSIILLGFVVALILNLVLGAQLWMYWGRGNEDPISLEEAIPLSTLSEESGASVPSLGQGPGRRWARKVD